MHIFDLTTVNETTNDQQQVKPTVKRGRKSKQTLLNEFYSIENEEANTSKASDVSLNDSLSIAKEISVKSSRYGRVIKPKSYDLEIPAKIKLEIIKDTTTDPTPLIQKSTIPNVTNPPISVVQPPKKRGRHKISEEENPTSSLDTMSSQRSESLKLLSAQRKSAERFLAREITPEIDYTENTSNPQFSMIEQIPPEIKRSHGRRSKSSMTKQLINENPKEKQQIHAVDDSIDWTETTLNTGVPKRCGRRSTKNVPTQVASNWEDSSVMDPSNNEMIVEMEPTPMPLDHRPRIKVKNPEYLFKRVEEAPPQNENVVKVPKKRGRKPLNDPTKDAVQQNGSKYKCGNCQLEIPKNRWKAHELEHIGVTYRVGIDEAIDIDDSATHSRIMIRYMKHNKIQYIKCPKCGEKKKSAIGYISHVEICGLTADEVKSLKAECEYCKKLYRRVSLPSHQQSFCTVRRLELAQQQADEMIKTVCETQPDENLEEVTYTESGRPKRILKKVHVELSKPVNEFIKVGSKITGGTIKNWTNQLQAGNVIHCLNLKCAFQSNSIDEMRTHFRQCRNSIFQCRICNKMEYLHADIVEHIESIHAQIFEMNDSNDDDADNANDDDFKETNESASSDEGSDNCDYDDDDDFDDDDPDGMHKRLARKRLNYGGRRGMPMKRVMEEESPLLWEMVSTFYTKILNTRSGYYRLAGQWTRDFIDQNYDLNVLAIRDYTPIDIDFVRLPQRELNKFLGLLDLKSPSFLCRNENQYSQARSELIDGNWNRLNFLENVVNANPKSRSAVLFCGGKITIAEWIPFPSTYNGNQVLAICAQSKGAKPLSLTNCTPPEKCKTLIQLWSISTAKTNTIIESADFMYGIAYEDGPIYAMAFCPSDAYVTSKRLAIVALPNTNGDVNIISMPDNISKAKANAPTMIKVKVDIKLQLGFNSNRNRNENNPQTITQLTWSRVKGHKVLCAGYNTGLVAVWNFEHMTYSHMCRKNTSDGIPVLVPQFTFLGALSFITQLDLHSDNEDNVRWVLVGALDRRIRLYDLHDPQLIPYSSQIFKSRIITGVWPMHWPIYLTIIDAVLSRMNGGLHIKPVLYTDNQPRSPNLCIDVEPSNLSFSDWLNTGIFGTDAGDLIMINFQQLLLHDRYDESSEQKIISSTDVFHEERPIISEENAESNENIKVLFNDFDEINLAPKMKMRIAPIDQYPYARITRTAINPNESHQKLFAIGYELGFCRIQFMP